MKNKKIAKEGTSIKMLLFYFALVISAIITAFIFRTISIINQSKFDGEHRFTVAFAQNEAILGIISVEPSTSSMSLLKIAPEKNIRYKDLNKSLGIIPDGYINSPSVINFNDPIPSILQSQFYQWHKNEKNITSYDLLQLWLYSSKIPVSIISVREIGKNEKNSDIDRYIAVLFPDQQLAGENLSMQIVNAAGVTGLGGRLERAITNLGGNIVSIQTAPISEKVSTITYFGNEDSYTLNKIKRLLPFKVVQMKKQGIADIVITIGEDNKKTNTF